MTKNDPENDLNIDPKKDPNNLAECKKCANDLTGGHPMRPEYDRLVGKHVQTISDNCLKKGEVIDDYEVVSPKTELEKLAINTAVEVMRNASGRHITVTEK